MERFVGGHFEPAFADVLEDAGERGSQHPQQHFEQHSASVSLADSNKPNYFSANGIHPNLNCDIKPRLTKEQHDILEAEYQKQHKPPTSTKKGFAESLGVSLDKVNNWFQNRRAKAKQDAKKALGAQNLYLQQQQQQQAAQSMTYSSSAEPSPAFTTSEYYNMMQQCTADDSMADGILSMQQTPLQQHFPDQSQFQQNPFLDASGGAEQYRNFPLPTQMPQSVFDSPNEINRRTLTQEQFDAFGGLIDSSNSLDIYSDAFQGNQDVLSQIFPNYQTQHSKQLLDYPNGLPMTMSNYESSIPSSGSERSASFPSNSSMQEQAAFSAPPSEWSDSRSSSAASGKLDAAPGQVLPTQQLSAATISIWQPGQSKPVDVNDLRKEFTQANMARQCSQQMQHAEQPLAFPSDEAFLRRDPHNPNSLLAQSMGNIGINTSQPQQQATFKSPLPPSSIASRRQRPGPLALNSGAMRSQSYSGVIQPSSSPGQMQSGQLAPTQQSLRRIKSSINGGVAAGRVQKSQPGSAQRSPLNFSTFAEAMNSPKALRHASLQSNDSLAPPTPLSPSEFPRQELQLPGTAYANSGQVSRQPSISETDAEHALQFAPPASTLQQKASSPPHTPMYYQQNLMQQRIGNNVITENTPPQSAPASQQCFPTTTFTAPPTSQAFMQPQAFAPQQHSVNVIAPEQHFQVPNLVYTPQRPQTAGGLMMARAPSSQQLSNSDAHAIMAQQIQLQMQMQMLQQALPQGQPQSLPPSQQQSMSQDMRTAPQASYQNMFSAAPSVPSMQVTAQVPKQAPQAPSEFFVHEYNPPESVKRAATPRKNPPGAVVEQKQYTFAHATPAHYAEKHRKANSLDGKTSTSPASSIDAGSV